MKTTLPLILACFGTMMVSSLQSALVAEWIFNTGTTSAAHLVSSNVAPSAFTVSAA